MKYVHQISINSDQLYYHNSRKHIMDSSMGWSWTVIFWICFFVGDFWWLFHHSKSLLTMILDNFPVFPPNIFTATLRILWYVCVRVYMKIDVYCTQKNKAVPPERGESWNGESKCLLMRIIFHNCDLLGFCGWGYTPTVTQDGWLI